MELTFSPMDTPPEVMMTSARLIPSCSADSKSSGLQTNREYQALRLSVSVNSQQKSNLKSNQTSNSTYPESPQGLKASLDLKTFHKIGEMITYVRISFLITNRVMVQKTTFPLFQPTLNGVQEIL